MNLPKKSIGLKIKLVFILLMGYGYQHTFAAYFKSLGVKDGLSQISVMSVHEDVLGRMWFGTLEGLSIYDGSEMITIQAGSKDFAAFNKKDQIFSIVEDKYHNIFLRAGDAIVKYQFDQGKFRCILPEGATTVASLKGDIYVAVKDSILLWDNDKQQFYLYAKTALPSTITRIFRDKNDVFWIGTGRGLYKKNGDEFQSVIPQKNIHEIFESRSGKLWIGTRSEGMYSINEQGRVTEFLHNPYDKNSISSNQVRTFAEDEAENLWIGTFTGLNKYSPVTKSFIVYSQDDLEGSLLNSSVYSLFRDSKGVLWVGTFYGGVSFFNPDKDFLTYYPAHPNRKDCLSFPFVGHITADKQNNLWICTEGGGLNFMNRSTKQFRSYSSQNSDIKHNNLKTICYDSIRDRLYMGSYTGGLIRYDIQNNQFKNYLDIEHPTGRLQHRTILDIDIERDTVFFLSESGLYKMDMKSEQIEEVFYKRECTEFLFDSKDNIWILHFSGITKLNRHNVRDSKTYTCKELGLSELTTLIGCESANGELYFGTSGYGLLEYDYETDKFATYTSEKTGLLSNYCYHVVQSRLGFLVLLSDKGLSFFDTKEKQVKHVISAEQLPSLAFNDGNGIFVAEDGTLFVGSASGMIQILEEELYAVSTKTSLFFTGLFINNEKVEPRDKSGILDQIIAFTSKISLKYNQNNLVLNFAGNNFGSIISPTAYEYRLDPFDKGWISTKVAQANYTNISSGKYVLRVRAKGVFEKKLSKEIALNIRVHQPFYNTFLAWLFYILVISGILYVIINNRQKRLRLRHTLELERLDKENIEELNRFKEAFFTNISHELRTPLTLIITQIEILMGNKELSKSSFEKVKKLYRHTYQLRNLISELLDFQKAEQQQMRLKVYEQNLAFFLEDIYRLFESRAEMLEIEYDFSSFSSGVMCYFDSKQLHKVFFNLIFNAFKYTKKGGYVKVAITHEDDIIVRVIDNGSGISKEDIERIFQRFYQASVNNTISKEASTGIGLALSKDIVKLHHGEISVESKPGYGSVFIVKLKTGKKHFDNDPQVDIVDGETVPVNAESMPDIDFITLLSENNAVKESHQTGKKRYTILIVEDNEELLSMLISIFSPLYNVVTAVNGEEGLQQTHEHNPDIILSDIMMPQMNGVEMCNRLKNEINTSHIPVVLLTARTSSEHQIEGLLQGGADDYITKPFDAKVLLVKMNTILRNREILRTSFKQEPDFHSELLANNELDQQFLKKVEETIKSNIENPDLDVELLIQESTLGRSSFFEKLKALTGMTPGNFILTHRLRYAAILLKTHPEYRINEIADLSGFSSGRYFSKCFKNYYHLSPMKYKEIAKQDMNDIE